MIRWTDWEKTIHGKLMYQKHFEDEVEWLKNDGCKLVIIDDLRLFMEHDYLLTLTNCDIHLLHREGHKSKPVKDLVIVALLVYLIYKTNSTSQNGKYDKKVTLTIWIALGLTLIQIILGTQVRQFVDHQIDLLGENAKDIWLVNPSIQFYIHRSFSILVVLINLYLAYSISQKRLGYSKIKWVLGILFIEVITGIVMFYFDFPFASQPLHLILAAFLFGIQFYLVLEATKGKISQKSL